MMYERPRVNVRVERVSNFTFTRYLPYIASILFRNRPFDFWGVVWVISEKYPAVGFRAKKTLKRKYLPYNGLLCTSRIRLFWAVFIGSFFFGEILFLNLTFAVYTWSLNSLVHRRSRINVKVETRSTFTFTRGLSYIAIILFTRAKFTCVCT